MVTSHSFLGFRQFFWFNKMFFLLRGELDSWPMDSKDHAEEFGALIQTSSRP